MSIASFFLLNNIIIKIDPKMGDVSEDRRDVGLYRLAVTMSLLLLCARAAEHRYDRGDSTTMTRRRRRRKKNTNFDVSVRGSQSFFQTDSCRGFIGHGAKSVRVRRLGMIDFRQV